MWSFRRTSRPRAPQRSVQLRLEALDPRLPPSSLAPTATDPTLDTTPTGTTTPAQTAAPTTTQIATASTVPLDPIATTTGTTAPAAGTTAPTGTISPTGTNSTNTASTTPVVSAPAPPQVVNFQGVEVTGCLWRFTGDVVDGAPAGLTVALGGQPPSLQGVTATTDANGHFDVSVSMQTNGADDGYAAAQTADGAGTASNVALYYISPG